MTIYEWFEAQRADYQGFLNRAMIDQQVRGTDHSRDWWDDRFVEFMNKEPIKWTE